MTKEKAQNAARNARSLLVKRLGTTVAAGGGGAAIATERELIVAACALLAGYILDAVAEYWVK